MRYRDWLPIVCLLLPGAGHGDVIDTRHGGISEAARDTRLEAGYSAVLQQASVPSLEPAASLSLDMAITVPHGPGYWTLYAETATTPRQAGIIARVPEINGDAGGALDGNGRGRLQISELHYVRQTAEHTLLVGQLMADGYLDQSDIAGNETEQFLATPFVHNPTIAFPDAAPGGLWHSHATTTHPGHTLLLAASHGLQDNPRHRYRELYSLGEAGKGIFAAGEMYWRDAVHTLRLGIWHNSARLPTAHGSTATYGGYLSLDHQAAPLHWNLRLGLAHAPAGRARGFIALALERPLGSGTLGMAAGDSVLTATEDTGAGRSHAELYWRLPLHPGLHLTPSLQWLEHARPATTSRREDNLFIAGLRLSQTF